MVRHWRDQFVPNMLLASEDIKQKARTNVTSSGGLWRKMPESDALGVRSGVIR